MRSTRWLLTSLFVAVSAAGWSQTSRPECDLLLNSNDVGRLASVEITETPGKPVTVVIKTGAEMSQGVFSWIFTAVSSISRTPISLAVLDTSGKPTRTLKLNDPQMSSIVLPEQKIGAKTPGECTITLTARSISRANGVPHHAPSPNAPQRGPGPIKPWSGSKFTLVVAGLNSAGLLAVGPMRFLPPGRRGKTWPELTLTFAGEADVASDWISAAHSNRRYPRARLVSFRDDGKTTHFDLSLYQVQLSNVSTSKEAKQTVVTVHLTFQNLGVLIGR